MHLPSKTSKTMVEVARLALIDRSSPHLTADLLPPAWRHEMARERLISGLLRRPVLRASLALVVP